MKLRHCAIVAVSCAFGLVPMGAVAAIIDNSTVQISGTAAFSGDYPQADAIDVGTNPNTDYASAGGGNSTFLDFAFTAPVTFSSITEADRVTSGGGNGNFIGGTGEFNTSYQYLFSNDPTFATILGTVPVTRSVPVSPTSAADFTTTTPITGIPAAQYVRFQVISNTGGATSNNGASNFVFESVPEPTTVGLLGFGLVSLFARRRHT